MLNAIRYPLKMNIVFFGSSNFAVPALKALIASAHKISCVVTQPDRKKGRGLHLEATAVKSAANHAGLKMYQPARINTDESIEFLQRLNPELFIVISYGQILSQKILDVPAIFAINAHASLLPKYRGAAPINWSIINGERISGITIIKMTQKMDAGPVILKEEVEIKDADTAITFSEKLAEKASELLINTLKLIQNKSCSLTPQDEKKASFAPKLKKEDGLIDWDRPAQDICNLVKGCLGWPGAFTYYHGKLLKIYKARVSSQVLKFSSSQVGEITEISKAGISVTTGKDNLLIEELQIEGKRKMGVGEFIAGYKIKTGEILG